MTQKASLLFIYILMNDYLNDRFLILPIFYFGTGVMWQSHHQRVEKTDESQSWSHLTQKVQIYCIFQFLK